MFLKQKDIAIFLLLIFALIRCNEVGKESGNKKTTTIGIQPLGNFDRSLIDTVKQTIINIYGFDVIALKRLDIPEEAYTNIKSPRYRADTLIRYLRRIKPDSIDYILGLTSKDISVTKKDKFGNIKQPEYKYKDWGIFGLAFVPGLSCIVSTFRLKSNNSKFIERFKKICIHELGHNLGLSHCDNYKQCVMRDAAETIKTIDQVDLMLCNKCKNEIGMKRHK